MRLCCLVGCPGNWMHCHSVAWQANRAWPLPSRWCQQTQPGTTTLGNHLYMTLQKVGTIQSLSVIQVDVEFISLEKLIIFSSFLPFLIDNPNVKPHNTLLPTQWPISLTIWSFPFSPYVFLLHLHIYKWSNLLARRGLFVFSVVINKAGP